MRAATAVVIAALAWTAATRPARADAYLSKKDRFLLDKRSSANTAGKPPPVGKPPAKVVNLFNTWTNEWLAVDATKPVVAPDVLDHFLRCHFTNEATAMQDKLLSTVVDAARHFDVTTIDVVSGFRHPKYNLMLRKKGHQVARDSQHTHGDAIDFYLPNIPTMMLHAWAKEQRIGGVGLYLESGFVHMDTGKVRYWSGE